MFPWLTLVVHWFISMSSSSWSHLTWLVLYCWRCFIQVASSFYKVSGRRERKEENEIRCSHTCSCLSMNTRACIHLETYGIRITKQQFQTLKHHIKRSTMLNYMNRQVYSCAEGTLHTVLNINLNMFFHAILLFILGLVSKHLACCLLMLLCDMPPACK